MRWRTIRATHEDSPPLPPEVFCKRLIRERPLISAGCYGRRGSGSDGARCRVFFDVCALSLVPSAPPSCPFCSLAIRTTAENDLAVALLDAYPVTEQHTLVVPRRHVAEYFDLTREEILACHELLLEARRAILARDASVTGFNVGINVGATAGQTVFHCHIHLIPRREGDVPSPRGGVRHVIPGKGDYTAAP